MAKLNVEQALARARSHARKGETNQARSVLQTVLEAFPSNPRARSELARLEATGHNHPRVRHPPQAQVDALVALYNQRRFGQVAKQAELLTDEYPSSFVLWNIYGAANVAIDELEKAEEGFAKAAKIAPDFADAHSNMGNILKRRDKLDDAIASYERALTINPDHSEAHYNMGVTLKRLGKLDNAIAAYQRALAIRPDHAEAHYSIGNALMDQGKLDDAIEAYQRALTIRPEHADAHYRVGNALKGHGQLDDAIEAYQRALAIRPDHADAYNNMGNALKGRGQLDDAIEAYQRALEIKPDQADAYYNMGNALMDQGKLDEAITACQRALAIRPNHADACNNMGTALMVQGKLDEAIAAYQRALAIRPDHAGAETHLLRLQETVCDFSISDRLAEASARLGISTEAASTFFAFSWTDDAKLQFLRSRTWVSEKYKQSPLPLPARPKTRPERLKIGYFSADMHNHPCMHLISGLLATHDRDRFEIFAFSYGPDKNDDMRNRVRGAVDHFIDIRAVATREIVQMARDKKIDISVDLNGYTRNGRTEIFQYRLSPVQVNFLGYPGSLAADFIDYIIADSVVIPEEQRRFYSEKAIYLPHTYQPSDNTREIAETNTTRSDFGLPEDGIVFCCFNNNYKISRREFDIWMRLLGKVDGSVLWLVKSNEWSERNLRKEAGKRGIDPSRVVFAEKLSQSEHLARHRHADLFIDTFNYNAHTTASDALWAGLPVVTKQGEQFAARVAASLLTAVGLPDLITESEAHYEDLILELATNPGKLAEIRARLSQNRVTKPLFDTRRYARNLENGLRQAYDRYFDGQQPQDIRVREADCVTDP
ncbi:O-linked N-acetylglucosamine transferase family protein [Roseovarius ramblicola]|uniref:protein O-GlcNAc transferase n=1 Tax=Roseovarius ramblicola TaxID=2022336 RepID=A0ABV5HWL0_9RHOB